MDLDLGVGSPYGPGPAPGSRCGPGSGQNKLQKPIGFGVFYKHVEKPYAICPFQKK